MLYIIFGKVCCFLVGFDWSKAINLDSLIDESLLWKSLVYKYIIYIINIYNNIGIIKYININNNYYTREHPAPSLINVADDEDGESSASVVGGSSILNAFSFSFAISCVSDIFFKIRLLVTNISTYLVSFKCWSIFMHINK